jgi:hypothetical protein
MEEKFVVSGPGNTAVDRAANRIGHEGTLRTLASAAGHHGVVKVCDCNADCSRVDRGRVTRGDEIPKGRAGGTSLCLDTPEPEEKNERGFRPFDPRTRHRSAAARMTQREVAQ